MNGRADRIATVMLALSLAMFAFTVPVLALVGVEHAAFQAAIACYLLLLAMFAMVYSNKK